MAKLRRRGGREAVSVGVSQPWNGVPGEAAPLVDITGARVRWAWAAISMDYQGQRAVSRPLWGPVAV